MQFLQFDLLTHETVAIVMFLICPSIVPQTVLTQLVVHTNQVYNTVLK